MLRTLLCSLLLALGTLLNAAPKLEVIHSGERKWELLLADLDQARKSICMDYYRFADDESGRAVRDVLVRKAREGIPVRLIVENIVHGFSPKRFFTEMREAGVDVRFFTDLNRWDALSGLNCRDHRKIVVVDSRIGYVGGMNLSDNYRYHWRDTHLRIEGPSVAQLERIFYQTWSVLGGSGTPAETEADEPDDSIEFIAGGPAYPVFVKRYLRTLETAREYAYFETPYLCPPDTLVSAMKAAAARGVDVRIIVPEKTDQNLLTVANRSFFQELLEAGVRVYEYLPRFDHSKVFICDDQCWIGSVNFDNRSLYIDYEICACLHDRETVAAQKDCFLNLLKDSHEVTPPEAASKSKERPLGRMLVRLLESQF